VLEGQVEVKPCGGAPQTAGPGESVTVSGDCSGSRHQLGRTVPRSRAVDQEDQLLRDPVGGDRELEKSPSGPQLNDLAAISVSSITCDRGPSG
jgi:hypothetical protein